MQNRSNARFPFRVAIVCGCWPTSVAAWAIKERAGWSSIALARTNLSMNRTTNEGKSRQYLSQLSSAATFHKSCPISQFMSPKRWRRPPTSSRMCVATAAAAHIGQLEQHWIDCANFHSIKSICSLKIEFIATKLFRVSFDRSIHRSLRCSISSSFLIHFLPYVHCECGSPERSINDIPSFVMLYIYWILK